LPESQEARLQNVQQHIISGLFLKFKLNSEHVIGGMCFCLRT